MINADHSARTRKSSLKKWMERPVQFFCRHGKEFCEETSIHGFKHITAIRRHWVERLLWACATSLAIWGTVDLTRGQLQRYQESRTVVTLEKDYRSWKFSLPAVTACYMNRLDYSKMQDVIKSRWNTTPTDTNYAYYAKFLEAVANSDLFNLEKYQEFRNELEVDLLQLAIEVMPINNLKVMSSETGDLQWSPVMTEVGLCFTTNSLAIDDVAIGTFHTNMTKKYPITCSYLRGCYLKVDMTAPALVYIHSPYDVADISTEPFRVSLTEHHTVGLAVLETRGGKGVKDVIPRSRGCLYTDEANEGRKRKVFDQCVLPVNRDVVAHYALHQKAQSHPKGNGDEDIRIFSIGGGPTQQWGFNGQRSEQQCKGDGMRCLAAHGAALASIGGQKCHCSPQCVYSVFREISNAVQILKRGPFTNSASLKLVVQIPKTRYTREIVFHFQDLVVSFGGATGLFLGASFVSFAEIFYFGISRLMTCLRGREDIKKPENTLTHEMARLQHYTAVLENIQCSAVFVLKPRY